MFFVEDWITFLSRLGRLATVPLLVGGVGLMLFGWRMRRVGVGMAFGVIGTAMAAWLLRSTDAPGWCAVASGLALGLASTWSADHAAATLGGLLGAGVTMISLSGVGLTGPALMGGGVLAFVAFTAFSCLHRSHILIFVTACLGAVLVVSGLAVCAMAFPGFYGHIHALSIDSFFVVPFFLLVPTVMSCMYQVGDMRRLMPDS